MSEKIDQNALAAAVDGVPNFRGLGIIVITGERAILVREPLVCTASANFIVVELIGDAKPPIEPHGRGIVTEGALAAVNCTAAVVAGLVTFGSAGASPFTGGSSLFVTGAAYAATVATGMSCGVAVMRTYNEVMDPEANVKLDNQAWYQRSMMVVDGVSLVGVGISAAAAARVLKLLGRSGVTLRSAVGGTVGRQGRARLAQEAAKAKLPGLSNKSLKAMQASGELPKRLTSTEISTAAVRQLRDALAAGLSFGASAGDGNIKSAVVYLLEVQ